MAKVELRTYRGNLCITPEHIRSYMHSQVGVEAFELHLTQIPKGLEQRRMDRIGDLGKTVFKKPSTFCSWK
ncbi:MAG: hypothetical protein NZ602_00130 [Thermoguttaceae bacterium]|nr:hypothetical protein [Thermoguttaceae bacterium]MDW8039368.1 hypothetical protein [Thermoguttaceae bacterium]